MTLLSPVGRTYLLALLPRYLPPAPEMTSMPEPISLRELLSRRELLQRCGMGMGALGLASLLGSEVAAAPLDAERAISPLAPKKPHFAPRAKRVIHLFMNGGP